MHEDNFPRLLAIDTATEQMAIAACAGARESTLNAEGGARASGTLIGAALARLDAVGLTLRDLDAVAFGCGPGAFTGLRTACAVAQGFALGAGVPVLPINSLWLVAEDARVQVAAHGGACDVSVAMDARMGEVYAGAWRWDGAAWAVMQAPVLCNAAASMASRYVGGLAIVAGTALQIHPALRASWLACGAQPVDHTRDRAGALLRLARWALAAGATVDAAQALPVYLRDKVAFTTRERASRKAAQGFDAPLLGNR